MRSCFNVELLDVEFTVYWRATVASTLIQFANLLFLTRNLYKYEFIDQEFSLMLVDIESALFSDLI